MCLKRSDCIVLFIGIILFVLSCANVGSPTGGPKDTTAPILVYVNPPNLTTNFDNTEIILEFNENIRVDNIQQNLLINPPLEYIEHDVKKETLTLQIKDTLLENTTYTFNFSGAVKDLNEGNKATNTILAYSTGSFIDSLSIEGIVTDNLTNKAMDNVVVAVVPYSDTINLLEATPRYVAITDETGNFSMNYLKKNDYLLYALEDKNNNYVIDTKNEAYGFIGQQFSLDSQNTYFEIKMVEENLANLKLNAARMVGQYFELKYSKSITGFTNITDSLTLPFYTMEDGNKTVRFYPNLYSYDSATYILSSNDSAETISLDTVQIKFSNSKRTPAQFSIDLKSTLESETLQLDTIQLKSTKPIINIDTSKIVLRYDSLYTEPLSILSSNKQQTVFNIPLRIDKRKLKKPEDSTATTNRLTAGLVESLNPFYIEIDSTAIISIDLDTTNVISKEFKLLDPTKKGIIKGTIEADSIPILIQLIDKNYNVVKEQLNSSEYEFKLLNPGDYFIRLIIDRNNNQQYDDGNITDFTEPETILFYIEPIMLKANFEIENAKIIYKPVDKVVENIKIGPWIN